MTQSFTHLCQLLCIIIQSTKKDELVSPDSAQNKHFHMLAYTAINCDLTFTTDFEQAEKEEVK